MKTGIIQGIKDWVKYWIKDNGRMVIKVILVFIGSFVSLVAIGAFFFWFLTWSALAILITFLVLAAALMTWAFSEAYL